MLLAQFTDSHIRTVEAPHATAPQEGPAGARHLDAHPGATLAACLRQAFAPDAQERREVPQLAVFTGDNAHGDHEAAAPYGKLKQALAVHIPPRVAVELVPGNHDRRHVCWLWDRGPVAGRVRLPGCISKAARSLECLAG